MFGNSAKRKGNPDGFDSDLSVRLEGRLDGFRNRMRLLAQRLPSPS